MDGLGRMEEERRRAGRGERGADLLADDAGLAEAHGHHAAGAGVDQLDHLDERAVEMLDQSEDRRRFDFQHALCLGEGRVDGH